MADLLAQARKDIQKITQAEFGVDLVITDKLGNSVAVRGLASKHFFQIDSNTGLPVSSKNTHVSINEQVLIDAGYTVRNANREVAMIGHLVTYSDSANNSWTFKINDIMPDETLGLIVLFLGDYE